MTELREKVAEELFDVWKEAKSDSEENWDSVTFRDLPESHKAEYYLTAERIIGYHQEAGYVRLADDQRFPEMAEWGTVTHSVQKDYAERMFSQGWRRVLEE